MLFEGLASFYITKNLSKQLTLFLNMCIYVAIGNEPFLSAQNASYLNNTFLALQNINKILVKAGLADQIKVTVPLNVDIERQGNRRILHK